MTSLDQVWEALGSQETFCAWEALSSVRFKRELEMYGKQRKAGFCENKNNSQVSDDDEDDEEDKYNPKGISRFSPPAFFRRLCMKIYVDISNGS